MRLIDADKAIELLYWEKPPAPFSDDAAYWGGFYDGIEKAIEILQEQPAAKPKSCKDAVSRKAVVRAVDKYTNDDGTLDDDITCILEEVPSVRPNKKQKKGKWLEKNIVRMDDELDDSNVIDAWQSARCSKCGKYHTTPFRYSFDHYEFCPNCGKPMKE